MKTKLAILLVQILMICLAPLRAEYPLPSQYIYVDGVTGSDSNGNGKTPRTAFKTIYRALAEVPPISRDIFYVIQLADGEYYADKLITGGTFSPTGGLIIQGNPQDRERVVIRGDSKVKGQISSGGSYSAFDFWSGGFIALQYLTVEYFHQGVVAEWFGVVTLRDVLIRNCDVTGIAISAGSLDFYGSVDIIMANRGAGIWLWPHSFLTAAEAPGRLSIQNAEIGIRSEQSDVYLLSGPSLDDFYPVNPFGNKISISASRDAIQALHGSRISINNLSFEGAVHVRGGSIVNLNESVYGSGLRY